MEILRFKTSLKCGGCINAIRPGLESLDEISNWRVDLEKPEKVLEVEVSSDISDKVIESVKKAGYLIDRL